MPNLVGVWNPAWDRETIESVVRRQLSRVSTAAREQFQEHLWIEPGFGMALQVRGQFENGAQPATSSDGQHRLLLDGEVFNATELARAGGAGERAGFDSAPRACVDRLAADGIGAARDFNGLFAIALRNHRDDSLALITDRYAFRPVFYVSRPPCLLFASELKALTVVDPGTRRVSPVGLVELFAFGSQVSGRTWLDEYRRLQPGTALIADREGARLEPYWEYRYDESAPKRRQGAYVEEFSVRMDRAVERCFRGTSRVGMFLSGGYDSRAIAGSIPPGCRPIHTCTFGLPESRDAQIAPLLAERLGLENHLLLPSGGHLFDTARSIVWRTEGMLPFTNLTSIQFHDQLEEWMQIVLTGFLGEFSGSHFWPALLMARNRAAAADAVFARLAGARLPQLDAVFAPSFLREASAAMKELFLESFERVPNEHPLNLADAWNLRNIQPQQTYQSPAVDRHRLELRAPHMDAELVEFLLTIPPWARFEQRVYKSMIATHYPSIRDVVCANNMRPIDPRFHLAILMMGVRYIGRQCIRPLRRLFKTAPPLEREIRDLASDIRAEPELRDGILAPLLAAGVFDPRIFDPDGIRKLVADHYAGRADHGRMIAMLISWGVAAQYLLHDDLSEVPPDFRPN